VSASVDSDTYFELMMRNAWHLAGGEGQAANSANLRVLVTHSDGSQVSRSQRFSESASRRVDDRRVGAGRERPGGRAWWW
jgi:hypothetical protein